MPAKHCICIKNCFSVVAVFSIDYNDELDTLVSGSADFTVKVWSLSAGTCVNTLTGHTEWVTKVRLILTRSHCGMKCCSLLLFRCTLYICSGLGAPSKKPSGVHDAQSW